MRCRFYIILCTGCIQSPTYHRTFFNNTLNCFLLLILQLQQPVCCLLCCLVYSILSSWISMELCIFPYQHRGGPDLPWHKKVSPFIQSDTAFPQAEVFLSTSPPPHRHRDLIICGSGTNVGICVRIRLDLRHLAAIIADARGHTDTVVLMSNMYSL